jgi:flagella basal body P-ring formation protein FlgA
MKRILSFVALLVSPPLAAEIVVPTQHIRAKELIQAEYLTIKPTQAAGALRDPSAIIGMEAKVTLYPGRPIRPGDIGTPALVDRNDTVSLIFLRGGLTIFAEGRALGRGAEGDIIRVMNTSSRSTLMGTVRADGSVEVK